MDNKDEILKTDNSDTVTLSDDSNTYKKSKPLANKNYKVMKCKVISYNKKTNTLDVLVHGYGIRLKNVENFDNTSDTVDIQYKGEIGKPNFEYKI